MIRIAIDAMGGDHAPEEIIKGAQLSAKEGQELIFVGDEEQLIPLLKNYNFHRTQANIVHAEEVIGGDEPPVQAVRKKPGATLPTAVRLIKEGKADAVLSAGNTGAFMAAAVLYLKCIEGIHRPAISPALPTQDPDRMVVLLDVGANMDAEAVHLLQYGIMGSLYAEKRFHIKSPKIGLLNVGDEAGKGSKVVQDAFKLLLDSKVHFVGNVESREIFANKADVVICDGFVGNAVLKAGEGLVEAIFTMMKKEFTSGVREKAGAALLQPAFSNLKRRLDYSEYGGAPLLGINGVCIKSHGSSNAQAISNGIKVAANLVEEKLLKEIREQIQRQEDENND